MNILDRFAKWIRRNVRDPDMPVCEPPAWLERMANDFVSLYPNACRGEWHKFAVLHAARAYQDGFRMGWERAKYGELPDASADDDPRARINVLDDEDLNAPVPVQTPEGYENVAFVDDRGTRYEQR